MIRNTFVLILLLAASSALATPDYEGGRSGTSVSYEDGSTVSIVCARPDQCDLTLRKGESKWTVRSGDFQGLLLLPSQLALVGQEKNGKFVVESEVACNVYSEGLPAYTCLAQLTIDNSAVVKVVVFKRTFMESRDAVPLIVE